MRRAQMLKKPNQTEARRRHPTSISHHPRGFISATVLRIVFPLGNLSNSKRHRGWVGASDRRGRAGASDCRGRVGVGNHRGQARASDRRGRARAGNRRGRAGADNRRGRTGASDRRVAAAPAVVTRSCPLASLQLAAPFGGGRSVCLGTQVEFSEGMDLWDIY
ncbi:hypothetical protein Cni_G22779 [Canna indica]|uniref:Uncharacterized protein n=1 Tax=Canna indica TaxID=4628 RepID=A0AAQ3KT00_9LILI|nr:hypothetical protein Cni_G22779 [Canna indica]